MVAFKQLVLNEHDDDDDDRDFISIGGDSRCAILPEM